MWQRALVDHYSTFLRLTPVVFFSLLLIQQAIGGMASGGAFLISISLFLRVESMVAIEQDTLE